MINGDVNARPALDSASNRGHFAAAAFFVMAGFSFLREAPNGVGLFSHDRSVLPYHL